MYKNGGLVELKADKIHGDGEEALKLKAGICGMVVRANRSSDDNHAYIVDFGPYGQWNCRHSELSGDDREGWDPETMPSPRRPSSHSNSIIEMLREEKYKEDEEPHVISFEEDLKRRSAELGLKEQCEE